MPAHARPQKRFPQHDVKYGHTVVIDYRFAEGSYDRLPVFTASARCLNCARKQALAAVLGGALGDGGRRDGGRLLFRVIDRWFGLRRSRPAAPAVQPGKRSQYQDMKAARARLRVEPAAHRRGAVGGSEQGWRVWLAGFS